MRNLRKHQWMVLSVLVAVVTAGSARAQTGTRPWRMFTDTLSTSACDLINANNAKLVVLADTGQLVLVNGSDVTLQDTFVDADGFVYFENEPVGVIDFAEDGSGMRSLWWMSLTGTTVNVNGFTGEPSQTAKYPSEFVDVPCDACDFWDDVSLCTEDDDDSETPPTVTLCGVDVPLTGSAAMMVLLGLRFARRRGPAAA